MDTISRIHSRRFKGFLLTGALLTAALFFAPAELYPVFAASLGTVFSVYATGQSYTDARQYEQGSK